MAQRRHPVRSDGRKKKRRRRKLIERMLKILCVLAVLTFAFSLIYTMFRVKKINVKGNLYTASQDVVDWMKKDRFSDNSLYIYCKYNWSDAEQLPSVESMEVELKSPWIVEVQVHEKELVGGIRFGSKYLYFDSQGIASLVSAEKLEKIPYIEGVDIEEEKVQLGEILPVEDTWIYQQIQEFSSCLAELELKPDEIMFENSGITLSFGSIQVLVGNDAFKEKLQQIPPILKKLDEQYEGVTGTLHLEKFDAGNTTIRFVPEQKLEDAEDPEDEDSYENMYVDEYGNVYGDTYGYGYTDEYGNTYGYDYTDEYGNAYGYGYTDEYGNAYGYGYTDEYGYTDGYGYTYEDTYGYGYEEDYGYTY